MAANGPLQKYADYLRTPWDNLIFKLHCGWERTEKAFLNRNGNGPGTMKHVRDDDPDGTMHLIVDSTVSDIGAGWDRTRFDFIDGHVLTLGTKFPQWSDIEDVREDWVDLGDEVAKLVGQPDFKLAAIKGEYDGQFPVYGIFLPDSVVISGASPSVASSAPGIVLGLSIATPSPAGSSDGAEPCSSGLNELTAPPLVALSVAFADALKPAALAAASSAFFCSCSF